jgi:hypothetical protein
MAMDGRYAGNAGAISGGCLDRTASRKRSHLGRTDVPEMQEQFPFWPDRRAGIVLRKIATQS